MHIALFILVGIAVVGGLIYASVISARKRTAVMSETAAALGLLFAPQGDAETSELRGRFDVFERGRSRKTTNVIHGEHAGTGVWIFDYQYTTGSGKHSHTHRQTVACFKSKQLQLPGFSLYREGLMSRIGSSVFGMQDIDFDSHPEFSKKFVLKGESESAVRETFSADVLSVLEQQDNHLRVEGNGDHILVYRGSRIVPPTSIQDFLHEGLSIFRAFLPA